MGEPWRHCSQLSTALHGDCQALRIQGMDAQDSHTNEGQGRPLESLGATRVLLDPQTTPSASGKPLQVQSVWAQPLLKSLADHEPRQTQR